MDKEEKEKVLDSFAADQTSIKDIVIAMNALLEYIIDRDIEQATIAMSYLQVTFLENFIEKIIRGNK